MDRKGSPQTKQTTDGHTPTWTLIRPTRTPTHLARPHLPWRHATARPNLYSHRPTRPGLTCPGVTQRPARTYIHPARLTRPVYSAPPAQVSPSGLAHSSHYRPKGPGRQGGVCRGQGGGGLQHAAGATATIPVERQRPGASMGSRFRAPGGTRSGCKFL